MPEFTPGDVFADYRIEALAGRGGMGVVYRATQLDVVGAHRVWIGLVRGNAVQRVRFFR